MSYSFTNVIFNTTSKFNLLNTTSVKLTSHYQNIINNYFFTAILKNQPNYNHSLLKPKSHIAYQIRKVSVLKDKFCLEF